MYNKTRLDNVLYNTISHLINEGKNRTLRELLLEGDDRLKKVKRIIQQSFSGTSLNIDGPVSSAEYYVGNKGANTTWMDNVLYSVRHTFGLMENKDLPLLVKVAKIAFEELEFEKSENHIDELNTLKTIVNLLKKDTDAANRVIKDPNVTYEKLYNEYADVLKQLKNDMRYRVNSKKYQKNQRYEIIPIDDFRTANEFGKYTGTGNGDGALCYTQGINTWNSFNRNGINQCYLCYTANFKDLEPIVTEGYPKDEYGLSMIWLFVDGNGELTNSNVRWNHGNRDFGNVDNMFTPEEISDIVGVNFYETFMPNDKWAKKVEEVQYRLKNGEDPSDVFDECSNFKEGFARVELDDRYNFINTNGEFLSPNQWFEDCSVFHEGFAIIGLNNKYNFINTDGEFLSPNRWFDVCWKFENGFAKVQLDGSWYFINTDGDIINDAVQQLLARGIPLNRIFDCCNDFNEGVAKVRLGNKSNFINANGELLSPNKWFDLCGDFKEGFAAVKVGQKWNFINTNGELVSPNQWFDYCYVFANGFAVVRLGNQYNYINTNGEILSPDMWFDSCENFYQDFAVVGLNYKYNFINADGELVSPKQWFNICDYFRQGLAGVNLDGKWYKIDTKGQLYNRNGEPINSPLQENYRYRKNKKQVIKITESQLRNAIGNIVKDFYLLN